MSHSRALILTSAVLVLLAAGCKPKPEAEPATTEPAVQEVAPPQEATAEDMMVATATLKTADGTELGTVTFTQHPGGGTEMVADLHGVQGAGEHGIHVHETGECSAPDFKSAGGHFNPQGTDHACPPTTPRHAGDFGNIEISADGSGHLDETSDLITVTPGDTSVVGKAVILHEGQDDCTSQPSGNAGPRLACGVVTLSDNEAMAGATLETPGDMDQEGAQQGSGD